MRPALILIAPALLALGTYSQAPQSGGGIRIGATNELEIGRPGETIVLNDKQLTARLPGTDLRNIHVRDAASGREILAQAVDLDANDKPDEFIFQADFQPKETRSFILSSGARQVYVREQFKVYGRFARERYDDFAWENDRIAHRMYGTALETWEKEPLTSSAVDVWCKRVRRLVVNDWYMVDNYHEDHGEGADFYSAGKSRGCGGSGIWEGNKLYVSRNFIGSRVLAAGPIRLVFELSYAPWSTSGREVSETKRITLDAGSNLDLFEGTYRPAGQGELVFAAGIKKGEGSAMQNDAQAGWLRTWEPVRKGASGNLGCAIIADPASIFQFTEAEGNYLVVARPAADGVARYYAGFGWDRSGDFTDAAAWAEYVKQAARRLRSPIRISFP